jgi:hypothetical protein
MSDYRRGLDLKLDILNSYRSSLQGTIALSLIHTQQFTTARTKSSQSAVCLPVDVPGLASSQAGGHLTPASYSSNCRHKTPSQSYF